MTEQRLVFLGIICFVSDLYLAKHDDPDASNVP